MRFSQRIGQKEVKSKIQLKSMDVDLRVSLWNLFKDCYLDQVDSDSINLSPFNDFFRVLECDFFKVPIETLPRNRFNLDRRLKKWFLNQADWSLVYDFIEFVSNVPTPPVNSENFRERCNEILKRELSGYRFIGEYLTPIADEIELKELGEALRNAADNQFRGVKNHISAALSKLSDRKQPDYPNSIKESVSAVESICRLIAGEDKADLGQALKIIKKKNSLHPALEKAFQSIYGYTSDEGGIRHSMLDEPKSDFADAKWMLVSCAAFINYLIMKNY